MENSSIDLSEQYLTECTEESTCDGTFDMEFVMNEALEGIPLEKTFPYNPLLARRGICSTRQKVHISDTNQFYYNLNQQELIKLLKVGPLSVVVSAEGWIDYQSGIYQCP